MAEWKEFKVTPFGHQFIDTGCKVQLYTGEEGVYTRRLRKNLEVIMKGKKWSIPPAAIRFYMEGDFMSEAATIRNPFDRISVPQTRTDQGHKYFNQDVTATLVKEGDVILLYRGANHFDIAKVKAFSGGSISGVLLNGKAAGKSFKWRTEFYIQKLDSARIANGELNV